MSLATVPCNNSVCTFVFFSTTNQVIYDIYLHDFVFTLIASNSYVNIKHSCFSLHFYPLAKTADNPK